MSDTPNKLLAIDPGCRESGFVIFDRDTSLPLLFGKWANESLLRAMKVETEFTFLRNCCIEMVGHYGQGMAVGKEVFDTCVWIGRFKETWFEKSGGEKWGHEPDILLRKTVVSHLCGSARAKDGNVRQAVIDRYGGDTKAIGGKRCKAKGCKDGMVGGKRNPQPCESCEATGWEHPPGPLKGIANDVWQALALALVWDDLQH